MNETLNIEKIRQGLEVENALKAIAQGDYGRCQHCHQMISIERLEVMPNATMCVNCQIQHG